MTGAIVFVCGRGAAGRAPDLTDLLGMTAYTDDLGRDPFEISPRLQEALATQAQIEPAIRYPVTSYELVRVAPGGITHVRDVYDGEAVELRIGDRLGNGGDTVLEIQPDRVVLMVEFEDPITGGTVRAETVLELPAP